MGIRTACAQSGDLRTLPRDVPHGCEISTSSMEPALSPVV